MAGPAFAVLVNFQWDLQRDRETQARNIALEQVELINDSMINLVEATRAVMVTLSGLGPVRQMDPACGEALDHTRGQLPEYVVMVIVRLDGTPLCHSAPMALPDHVLRRMTDAVGHPSVFSVGQYADLPGLRQPMLSFALPFDGMDDKPAGIMVAGLDVQRLATLLAGSPRRAGGTMTIRDRDAVLLARTPDSAGRIGERSDGLDRSMMTEAGSGAAVFQDGRGRQVVRGYVPLALEPAGLFVSAGFDVDDLDRVIDDAAKRGYLLISLGMACSFLFALLIGYRYLRAPAAVLLEAARRWGGGDLAARAKMSPGAPAEFAGLGQAFNEMAEMLQRQRSELQGLNDALEIRVAERTRALLESNNRLQVEIAEREMSEANLRQAQKLQAVGQLAGGIAHDFNNLLTVILGNLELLRKRLPAGEQRLTSLVDAAAASVDRGSRLTAQLLGFSRKQPLLAVSIDVSEALHGIGGLLAHTLGGTIRLQIRSGPELWPALLDPNQFEAAILNLALNAQAAMPNGGRLSLTADNLRLTPDTIQSGLPPGDYVRVVVADSGIGMSSDVMSRAFEPFFTTKEMGTGAGLGLAQVHGMVSQSGGAVMIDSRVGDGTTVTMLLPRAPTEPLTEGAIDTGRTLPALARDQLVLLVDDDTQVRDTTGLMLTEAGYSVVAAADGAAGLALLEREGPRVAVVIADYAMPGMTGKELLDTVRRRRPDVAILLATGYADYPDLTSATLAMDQIIRKPFRSWELLARIHMVCEHQRLGILASEAEA